MALDVELSALEDLGNHVIIALNRRVRIYRYKAATTTDIVGLPLGVIGAGCLEASGGNLIPDALIIVDSDTLNDAVSFGTNIAQVAGATYTFAAWYAADNVDRTEPA